MPPPVAPTAPPHYPATAPPPSPPVRAGTAAGTVRAARPEGQKPRRAPPSTGNITPLMYEAAGESRNAAALPNSSGVP
ncbi:hypothetical protein GCM10023079_43020 [Streptomyces chitinivorans]